MVEKSHSAGWMPDVYEPFRNIGQKIADWFAPASDASAVEDSYEINIELPGVKAEDVDVTIKENNLIVRGHKHAERQESGRSYFFSEQNLVHFNGLFACRPTLMATILMLALRTECCISTLQSKKLPNNRNRK